MKSTNQYLSLLFVFLFCQTQSTAQVYARNGMVASANKIASEIGVDVLQKGGNAIDASVATAFALAVVHPTAGNIGGGGFLVFMDSSGTATTIDFREKAPLKASADMFMNDAGEVPVGLNLYGDSSTVNHIGALSAGVPGTVAGLFMAHQKYGSLPWSELIQPAINLATEGFPLSWTLYTEAKFMKENSPEPFMQRYFNNADGKLTQFGENWQQPELAQTLRMIRDKGHDGFYAGPIADEIAMFMEANGGIITRKDLNEYRAVERKPIQGTYGDYEIFAMPPPSSGGVALVEMMNLMELADLDSIEYNSTAYVHLLAEAMRRTFADRAEFMGDPDFNPDLPIDKLTSKEHAAQRFEYIDFSKASKSDSSKFGQLYDGTSTTHFSVMDQYGNAVSLTYTLEHSYGSGVGSKKLGFIFNNEMGDFNPQPGVTKSNGQIGTDPNQIQPEKRMLSSMSPTIIAKDGKPYLVIGSPGGRTIINTVFQTVLCVLAYDMQVDQAIEALKVHHQWLPDKLFYEQMNLSPDTREALEQMGHQMVPVENLGRLMGIQVDTENHILIGASDSSSKDGAAVGY